MKDQTSGGGSVKTVVATNQSPRLTHQIHCCHQHQQQLQSPQQQQQNHIHTRDERSFTKSSPSASKLSTTVTSSSTSSSSVSSTASTQMCNFRDQMTTIAAWFEDWNGCEQTVALCTLIKKLSPTQVKFIITLLNGSNVNGKEIEKLEKEANDLSTVSRLENEANEKVITHLLDYLPLLSPGNEKVKLCYLSLIHRVLSHSVNTMSRVDEARQILCYSLIHPAMTQDEKRGFGLWCHHFEEKMVNTKTSGANNVNNVPIINGVSFDGGFKNRSVLSENGNCLDSQSHYGDHQLFSATNKILSGWRSGNPSNNAQIYSAQETNSTRTSNYYGPLRLHGVSSDSAKMDGSLYEFDETNGNAFQNKHISSLAHHGKVRRSSSLVPSSKLNIPTSMTGFYNMANKIHDGVRPMSQAFLMKGAGSSPFLSTSMVGQNGNSQLVWNKNDSICDDFTSIKRNNGNVHQIKKSSESSGTASYDSTSSSTSNDALNKENCSDLNARNSFTEEGSGMKLVPIWLKSLRLHKYSEIFSRMTYEDMMALTEEELERMNITKGARHKIILNINKLRSREENLKALERSLDEEGSANLSETLKELKYIMGTPIKPFSGSQSDSNASSMNGTGQDGTEKIAANVNGASVECDSQSVAEGDLPGQIAKVMGKVCSTILMSSQVDDDAINTFITLTNVFSTHEAFDHVQKRRLSSWRQQVENLKLTSIRQNSEIRQVRGYDANSKGVTLPFVPSSRKWGQNVSAVGTGSLLTAFGGVGNRRRLHSGRQHATLPQSSYGNSFALHGMSLGVERDINLMQSCHDVPDNIRHLRAQHVGIHRTLSAPVRPANVEAGQEVEQINNQMESLCLRMTEHALGYS